VSIKQLLSWAGQIFFCYCWYNQAELAKAVESEIKKYLSMVVLTNPTGAISTSG